MYYGSKGFISLGSFNITRKGVSEYKARVTQDLITIYTI